MDVKNPSRDLPKPDEIVGGFDKIEDFDVDKTLEIGEIGEIGGIGDAQMSRTLDCEEIVSVSSGIAKIDVEMSKTLEKSSETLGICGGGDVAVAAESVGNSVGGNSEDVEMGETLGISVGEVGENFEEAGMAKSVESCGEGGAGVGNSVGEQIEDVEGVRNLDNATGEDVPMAETVESFVGEVGGKSEEVGVAKSLERVTEEDVLMAEPVGSSVGEVGGDMEVAEMAKSLGGCGEGDVGLANSVGEVGGEIEGDGGEAKAVGDDNGGVEGYGNSGGESSSDEEDDYGDEEVGIGLDDLEDSTVDEIGAALNNSEFGGMSGPLSEDFYRGCDCYRGFGGEKEKEDEEARSQGVLSMGYQCPEFPGPSCHGRHCRNLRKRYFGMGQFMSPRERREYERMQSYREMHGSMEEHEMAYLMGMSGSHVPMDYRDELMHRGLGFGDGMRECMCGRPDCMHRRHEFMDEGRYADRRHGCNCGQPACMSRRSGVMGRRHDHMRRDPVWSPHLTSRWQPEPEPEPCPVGAGLRNLGNTCFMNAILQCFTHTVPFVEGLQSLKHQASSHGENEFCVLCAVRGQIEQSIEYSGRVLSPTKLVENLSHISSDFCRYQQEDAHDFLMSLLDKLDCNWSNSEATAMDLSSADSLVKQLFGGRLVSQIRCSKCGHSSDTYDPVIDLSLEIEDVDSLTGVFESFTKVEDLEDYTCGSCKERVKVEKQLMLDQVPAVAALHLKRFKSDGVFVEKIDKMVKYPLELDLAPYTKGARDGNEDLKYELLGFVVHFGLSATSGHYSCYIRASPDEWYWFDDSKVTRVSETIALSQDAYILFYARKGTPWFSSLLEKWKARTDRTSSTSPKSVLDSTELPSTSHPGVSLHGCEAAKKRDGAGDICVELLSGPIYDAVENKAGDSVQDSALADLPAFLPSVANQDEVPVDSAKLDVQLVGTTGDCKDSSACINYGGDAVEENNRGEIGKVSVKTCSRSNLKDIFVGVPTNDIGIKPSTPPRPDSPDIYSDEKSAEVTYKLPVKRQASSAEKSTENGKLDWKRKEAAKYINKSMPSGRRKDLLAALNAGSSSDSTLSRKKRKQSSLFHKHSPPKRVKISPKRVKISPKRILRQLGASV